MPHRGTACALIVTGAVLLVPVEPQAETSARGFVGTWEAIDCAYYSESGVLDCERWGDGSRMTLQISAGATPAVTYQDEYSSICEEQGSSSTRWVAAGKGEYLGAALFVTLSKSGCGRFDATSNETGAPRQLYWDEGSDTVWEDSDGDGYGYLWRRKSAGCQ